MLILKNQSLDEMLSSEKKHATSGDLFSSTISKQNPMYKCFWQKQDDFINLPIFIVPDAREIDTLFADVSTFHQSISPLSAYAHICHEIVAEQLFLEQKKVRTKAKADDRKLRLNVALILGEAVTGAFLAQKDLLTANVGYAACTQTLAASITRAANLYPKLNSKIIFERWELARKLTNQEDSVVSSEAVLAFLSKIEIKENDLSFTSLFLNGQVSENELFFELTHLFGLQDDATKLKETYNSRMSVFNSIVGKVEASTGSAEIKSACIAFFCNKILPGSMSHVASLKPYLSKYYDIVFWYMAFACLSSEFDVKNSMSGICYKLIRDIVRPFSVEERPTCDVSIDELEVISRVSMKASTLKPKRSRVLVVSLLPGVDVELRLGVIAPVKKVSLPDADFISNKKLKSLLFEAIDILNGTSRPDSRSGRNPK
ncbi:hypothetical protein [Pseudomonas sp. 31 R 17]|uniref:hypothetical protein n=1 Tax=Pseudomonas sp. 31 R 17 TaxID=1844101 RepID=UPI0008125D62|nr:hypothetical protein [Pseudomonas sp. 31 R 17]CRM53533.1 hypothetical protein [Pseudomonas sp. 31 R 17]